jgi:hypothetical protein
MAVDQTLKSLKIIVLDDSKAFALGLASLVADHGVETFVRTDSQTANILKIG